MNAPPPTPPAKTPLVAEHVAGRPLRLYAEPSGKLVSEIALRPDGCVLGRLSNDQAAWRVEGDTLVLLTARGEPSCVMVADPTDDGALSLTGPSLLPDDATTYRLVEAPSAQSRLAALPETLHFGGEFGQEMSEFIPFVHWLQRAGEMRGRRVSTYAGMDPFYFFLAPGQIELRQEKRRYFDLAQPRNQFSHANYLRGVRSGMEWSPDYRARYAGNFGGGRPLLLIHNKYTREWGGPPVNFLAIDVLERLFARFEQQYRVIYFEAARPEAARRGYSFDNQGSDSYNDVEVARAHPEVTVFGDLLARRSESYNLLKLKLFASCRHFITVQGGNAHMCALFPGSLVAVLHVRGEEFRHGYGDGTFQSLASPPPMYLIARDGTELLQAADAFGDCVTCAGRVHLGASGVEAFRRFGAYPRSTPR